MTIALKSYRESYPKGHLCDAKNLTNINSIQRNLLQFEHVEGTSINVYYFKNYKGIGHNIFTYFLYNIYNSHLFFFKKIAKVLTFKIKMSQKEFNYYLDIIDLRFCIFTDSKRNLKLSFRIIKFIVDKKIYILLIIFN